jgi:endonuclease V-like protein UPF0215 family
VKVTFKIFREESTIVSVVRRGSTIATSQFNVRSMKELHDERLDIPVLSVCSVVCDVQMIEVIRKNLW